MSRAGGEGFQAHGVEPDMITFAKGLGNGLAIGGASAAAT
jgi:4-aminobutyrate aminotransferase